MRQTMRRRRSRKRSQQPTANIDSQTAGPPTGRLDRHSREELIRTALSGLPVPYEDCHNLLLQLTHAFWHELAAAFEPRLYSHLLQQPYASYDDRRALASWVNGQLHDLGLTIRCPKTGKPALLIADLRDATTGYSRFRLDVHVKGGRRTRTASSVEVPDLELMEAPRTPAPLAKWTASSKPA